MSDNSNLCSICSKPKKLSGSASITQWIALCACDSIKNDEIDSNSEKLEICENCGKRVGAENKGSFTQFIFRTEYCRCGIPKTKLERKFDFYTSPQLEYESAEDDKNIYVSPDLYPSDRYKPLRLLGEGSVGAVYLCKDEFLSKNVTLKLLKSIQIERLIEFQEEAKATSRLNHPSIVKILDFGVSNQETPYMVLEYFKGRSLEEYLKDSGPLNWFEASAITIEVAGALAYSHTLGVFHRDVKPSNILIRIENDFPIVKVIDFGLAKAIDERSETVAGENKNLVGTPTYMSPEIINGGKYDARSEVYSLGCILYELLTGDPPFKGENILSTLKMHINNPIPKISGLIDAPEHLEQVVDKALSKKPEHRYPNMDEFREALEGCYQFSGNTIEPKYEQAEPVSTSNNKVFLLVTTVVFATGLFLLSFLLQDKGMFPFGAKREKVSVVKQKANLMRFEDCFSMEDTGNYLKIYSNTKIRDKDLKLIRRVFGQAIHSRKSIHLNLNGHELDGSGFKYLKDLPIRSFVLDSNSLKEENLRYLAKISTIVDFEMHYVKNAKDVFKTVISLPKISKVNFHGCKIGDDAFERISKSQTLRDLFVSDTGISDRALSYISKIKKLNSLSIAGNDDITLKGFRTLLQLPYLEFLDVNHLSNFNGDALKIVSRSQSLRNIHLTGAGNFKPKSLLYLNRCKNLRKLGVYDLRPISKFLPYIVKLRRVKDLIVTDTDISDKDLPYLLKIKGLRNLTIAASPHISIEELSKFKKELSPTTNFHSGVESIEGNIDNINELLQ